MAKKKQTQSPQPTAPAVITKTMPVSAITDAYPQTRDTLAAYGLHCFGCAFNALETLEEGCKAHGFDEHDIENLVTDLNDIVARLPARPQMLTITLAAADAIRNIATQEEKDGWGLCVIAEEHGGFCMEFMQEAPSDHRTFRCDAAADVFVHASPDTLLRIGGSTIDFREGRFKLDVESACACGGTCDCG